MSNQTAVVITSIAAPTRAVEAYAGMSGLRTIVIGDTKTPAGWQLAGADYLSIDTQRERYGQFAEMLPVRHYCRKNIGYLEAIRAGCEAVVDTDDDNIPLENWFLPDREGEYASTPDGLGFINVYAHFSDQHIWPRGLPLDCVRDGASRSFAVSPPGDCAPVPVWQGLANGDPDVDAIYRLVDNSPCTFEDRAPLVLGAGTVSPYNSQNTVSYAEAFPLLYLPSYVSFRFTDILRGLIGQVILWDHGYRLGFFKATVFQERNDHDYMVDFADEIPVYLHAREVIDIARDALPAGQPMIHQLQAVYAALVAAGIVGADELPLVESWAEQLAGLGLTS